jgi:hypothetical protein
MALSVYQKTEFLILNAVRTVNLRVTFPLLPKTFPASQLIFRGYLLVKEK